MIQGEIQLLLHYFTNYFTNYNYLGNLVKKNYLHTKEGWALLENYQKHPILKMFFFFFIRAGMKREGGVRALASSARGKEETNLLF